MPKGKKGAGDPADYNAALEACKSVVAQAYALWLVYDVCTDHISVVIVYFDQINKDVVAPSAGGPRAAIAQARRSRAGARACSAIAGSSRVRPISPIPASRPAKEPWANTTASSCRASSC